MSDEDSAAAVSGAETASRAVAAAIAQEKLLLDPAVRADSSRVDALLAPDFSEIGQDGRRWSRNATIGALARHLRAPSSATNPEVIESPEAITFDARVVAPGIVLVFYDTVGSSGGHVRRSTLWRETQGGWQAVFHQATPVVE